MTDAVGHINCVIALHPYSIYDSFTYSFANLRKIINLITNTINHKNCKCVCVVACLCFESVVFPTRYRIFRTFLTRGPQIVGAQIDNAFLFITMI